MGYTLDLSENVRWGLLARLVFWRRFHFLVGEDFAPQLVASECHAVVLHGTRMHMSDWVTHGIVRYEGEV